MSVKIIFAVPGAGKTTYASMMVQKLNKGKKYKNVLTTFPCFGATQLDNPHQLGKIHIEDSAIIIDEAGLTFNNRNWKALTQETTEFLKLHRHYGCDIWFISQTYSDMDVKIRDLADEMYLMKKIGSFTYLKTIWKSIGIDENKQITDTFGFKFFLSNKIIYRPKYYKFFNSWERKTLTYYNFNKWTTNIVPVTMWDKFTYRLRKTVLHIKTKTHTEKLTQSSKLETDINQIITKH